MHMLNSLLAFERVLDVMLIQSKGIAMSTAASTPHVPDMKILLSFDGDDLAGQHKTLTDRFGEYCVNEGNECFIKSNSLIVGFKSLRFSLNVSSGNDTRLRNLISTYVKGGFINIDRGTITADDKVLTLVFDDDQTMEEYTFTKKEPKV